jgi:alpha-glucosidase
MAKLRKANQALRYGGCQVIYAEDNVVVFVRVYKQQRVLVAINRGEACEVVSRIRRCSTSTAGS